MSAPWGTHEAALLEDDVRTLAPRAWTIALGGFTCPTCRGARGFMVEGGRTCAPVGSPPLHAQQCRDCGGDGRETCDSCGEARAVVMLQHEDWDQALCARCMDMEAEDKRAGAAEPARGTA